MERENNWTITCNGKCRECHYEWRDAAYNPSCLIEEILDFIDKKNKNIRVY